MTLLAGEQMTAAVQDAADQLLKIASDPVADTELSMAAIAHALEAGCGLDVLSQALKALLSRIAWNAAASVAAVELLLSCGGCQVRLPLFLPGETLLEAARCQSAADKLRSS